MNDGLPTVLFDVRVYLRLVVDPLGTVLTFLQQFRRFLLMNQVAK